MHLELDLRTPVCGLEFFWRKSHGTRQKATTCKIMQNPCKTLQNTVEEKLPFLGPAANASVDSMDVSMTSSGNPVKGGMLWWVISDAKRRPSDGDHTQHPSGTAERNTL